MKKSLCWFLAVMLFCAVAYGGCGGSSSDSFVSDEDETNQSQDVTPTNPNTSTPQSQDVTPTPTNPNTPTPQSQDITPTNPNTPTEPEPQPTTETPSVQTDLNGIWEGEKGSGSFQGGYVDYDEQYLDYTSPRTFTITVTKNANDEYYTIVFSGEGVHDSGTTDSYINAVFYTRGAANVDSHNGEARSYNPFQGAGDKFEKVSDTVYRMVAVMASEQVSNGVSLITTYTLLESSRAECKRDSYFVDDKGFEHNSNLITFNIKRAAQ